MTEINKIILQYINWEATDTAKLITGKLVNKCRKKQIDQFRTVNLRDRRKLKLSFRNGTVYIYCL